MLMCVYIFTYVHFIWLPAVVAGESDDSVWDEAAVPVPVDRAGGTGGVPARGAVVRGVSAVLQDQGRANHLSLLCKVSGVKETVEKSGRGRDTVLRLPLTCLSCEPVSQASL